MAAFNTPVDIANRALQMVGATRITALSDDSKNAAAVLACYDQLLEAELRRNVWRFAIRETTIRPITETSLAVTPAVYDPVKTYPRGALVSYGSKLYQAVSPAAVAVSPLNILVWFRYFGNLIAEAWDDETSYGPGELVYYPSTTSAKVYISLESGNEDTPGTTPDWSATTTYRKGEVVLDGATPYQSKVDLNLNFDPSASATQWETIPATQTQRRYGRKWLEIGVAASGATYSSVEVVYPVGAGAASHNLARSVYYLPYGYLKIAPQNPKAGATSFLGASGGDMYRDWDLEAGFLVTTDTGSIVFRYVASIDEVYLMDPLFCNGLACRIGVEVCEELTQSDSKLAGLASKYTKFMGEARTVNGIETGPTEPPEDDFISCRR